MVNADIGEFLNTYGLLPPQLEKDADVVESFMPAAFIEEIDEAEKAGEKYFNTTTKKQKVSQFGKPLSTESSQPVLTMRRRQPTKFTQLAKKVNKLQCCTDTETHMVTKDITVTGQTNATIAAFLLNEISQGDGIENRTGLKIQNHAVQLSINFQSITGPMEVFIVRPSDATATPSFSQYQFNSGPGKMLEAGDGWVIKKWTIDPVFRKHLDAKVRFKLNSTFHTSNNNPVTNRVYLIIINHTGAPQSFTGAARLYFTG